MKTILIFGGLLCVFVTALPHNFESLNNAGNIVEKFAPRVQNSLSNAEDLSRSVGIENQTEIDSVIASAKTQINAALAKIESTLNDLLVKGGAIALCARSIFADLNAVRNTFTKQVEACSANFITTYEAFNVFKADNGLSTSAIDLNVDENMLTESLEPVEVAVKVVEPRSFMSIVEDIRSCAQKTVAAASVEINKLSINIQLCSI